jgi:hypothetical protein
MDNTSHAFYFLKFVSNPQFGLFLPFCLYCDRDRIHGLKGGCVRGTDTYTYLFTLRYLVVLYSVVMGPCIYIMCPAYAGLTLY